MALTHLGVMHLLAWLAGGRGATPFVVFPRSPTGPGSSDSVPADSAASQCHHPIGDTADWTDVVIQFSSPRITSLTLSAPPEFHIQEYSDASDGDGEFWGQLLVVLHTKIDVGEAVEKPSNIAFWIGPTAGYPTIGVSPGTRQLSFSECQDTIYGIAVHFAQFTLRAPRGELTYHVAAFWQLTAGVVVTASGSGPDPSAQRRILAIMRSARIE